MIYTKYEVYLFPLMLRSSAVTAIDGRSLKGGPLLSVSLPPTQSQNVPFAGVVTVVEWTDGGRKSPSDRSSQSFDAFELFAVACRWICVTAILAL